MTLELTPSEALAWILVGGLGLLIIVVLAVLVIAAVQTLKKNPLKQSFDIPEDKKEQDQ